MRRQPWGLYAIALAIMVVGLVAVGVPMSTLLFTAFVLVCPLMMMFMMAGMHGGPGTAGHNREPVSPTSDSHDHDHTAADGSPAHGWRRSQ
jgi:hypothetical protein